MEGKAEQDPYYVRPVTRRDVRLTYCRASGAGGQHVNKTESKVQLYFNPREAEWLPPPVRAKFLELHGKKLSAKGEFIIHSQVGGWVGGRVVHLRHVVHVTWYTLRVTHHVVHVT